MGEESTTNTTTPIDQFIFIAVLSSCFIIVGICISYVIRKRQRLKAEKELDSIALSLNFRHNPPSDNSDGDVEKCIIDIEPKSINMAQDQAAYERMLARSAHNLDIIMAANKQLREERGTGVSCDDRPSKCVKFERDEHPQNELLRCSEYNLDTVSLGRL